MLYPSPEQDKQLSAEYYTSAEVLSFANLHYPHHPSRGIGFSRQIRSNGDHKTQIDDALCFFRKSTFIYHAAARRIYEEFLDDVKILFDLLCSADESIFESLFKIELAFDGKHKELVSSLYKLLSDYYSEKTWTKGLIVDFEWLSAGEAHLALLFSAIYQRFSKTYEGFDRRHGILSIDEPEMHIHPETGRVLLGKMQSALRGFKTKGLLNSCQVIFATHSPFIIQQLSNYNSSISLVKKDRSEITINDFKSVSQIKYPNRSEYSFGLVLYKVFGVPTTDLHNELYGVLQEQNKCYSQNDIENFFISKGLKQTCTWIKELKGIPQTPESVTLQTFIRHSIHHPENSSNKSYCDSDFKHSIDEMLNLL